MHDPHTPHERTPDETPHTGDEARAEARDARPTQERVQEAAGRFGRMLGRSVERARVAGGEAARDARPEVERLARSARSAAEATRPRIEQAGRQAMQYVREHESDIKQAARVGAQVTAHQVLPMRLRPIIAAVEADRWRRAPYRDERGEDASPPADGPGGEPPRGGA